MHVTSRSVRARLRSWARDTRDSVAFQLKPPPWDDLLGEDLPFGADGEALFGTLLAACRQYLEYGAGCSTFAAARAGVALTTVESDARFLAAVERRCRSLAPPDARSEHFLHGDIGRTGPWGKPVVPGVSRPGTWRTYPLAPWLALGQDFRSDFVLIDGRFRVACALAVIGHQPDTSWIMLVDDYVGRDEYAPIADFAELNAVHGRMAEFRPKNGIELARVEAAFARFASDWR